MPRFFNTGGPCNPDKHYMLSAESRLPAKVRPLIDRELYFVVHAPRQSGKSTCFRWLAQELNAQGRYVAVHASCEAGQAAGSNIDQGVGAILDDIEAAVEESGLPEELCPEPVASFESASGLVRLNQYLRRWSERSARPVVLFLDEIDALMDETLVSVLRQLRSGYIRRPERFPLSVALIGMRDVRDYKASIREEMESMGTASPFNIKVDSLSLKNFTSDEVAELYSQHTTDTGQAFTPEASRKAWDLTQGQPWLVNALANQITFEDTQDTNVLDTGATIETASVEQAAEALIVRRDTHLDSLIERLREPRVERVIAPILAGELVLGDRIRDDIAYTEDLGLVVRAQRGGLQIANPIYHEVIPRALAHETQDTIYHETEWYLTANGRLDMKTLLTGFLDFWRQHGDPMLRSQPYKEVAFQLVVMSFLQRIINGGGQIAREYAIGRGRLDLCIHWPHEGAMQSEVLELKVWRDKQGDPKTRGLTQLDGYLESLGLDHGALLIFDRRSSAAELAERSEMSELKHNGRKIWLLRL